MSRFLKAKSSAAGGATLGPTPGKEILERVAKYIPLEILAPYLAIQSFLGAASASGTAKIVLACCCALGWAAVPLYIGKFADAGDAKRTHQLVGTIAYPVWVYGAAVTPDALGFYDGNVAGGLLFVFTIVSGFIVPRS